MTGLDSLGQAVPSGRRGDAMVRCALGLGLRTCEVTKLSLDDIDWQAGTITLRKIKSRGEDVLPLSGWRLGGAITYFPHD